MMTKQSEKIAGLILMAGASSRMGAPKQLLKIGEKTMVQHLVDEALQSNLDQVILVVARLDGKMEMLLAPYHQNPRFRVIENRRSAEGMSTSIIAGLEVVAGECDHIMFILGDMPGVDAKVINHLLHGYRASQKTLGAMASGGKRSHPVIFGREWFGKLRKLHGDRGGRALLERHKEELCLVEAPPGFDYRDIDTPEDYRAFLGERDEPLH